MSYQQIEAELIVLAAKLFNVPTSSLNGDAKAGTIEAWDSMGHLELFMAIESQWKVKFSTDEIVNLSSLSKIAENISTKTG